VESCYKGSMKSYPILLDETSQRREFKYYVNDDNRMIHIWLAAEHSKERPSPAGEFQNKMAYEFLWSKIKTVTKANKTPLLLDIIEKAKIVLETGYISKVKRILFEHKDGNMVLKGHANPEENPTTKKMEIPRLKLLPEKLITEGTTLIFQKHETFNPKIDILETETAMIVNVDLPGFMPNKSSASVISVPSIDRKTFDLVIKGTRNLSYKQISEDMKNLTDEQLPYSKESKLVIKCERDSGDFDRRIPIPPGFDRNKISVKKLDHGVLQIVVKRLTEDDTPKDDAWD